MTATALDPATALVVVDLQRGLSHYPTVHPFYAVVSNTGRLVEAFRRAKLPVVLVTVAFSADAKDALHSRAEVRCPLFR